MKNKIENNYIYIYFLFLFAYTPLRTKLPTLLSCEN